MTDVLPEFLARRTRVLREGTARRPGPVVYWMCTAVRATENPALDVARLVAASGNLPLLVYHGLSERYPYANDRHHRFILEGARDVQRDLRDAGIPYLFHLARREDPPLLRDLAQEASLVIAEDFPTPEMRRCLAALIRGSSTPIWTVDTACLVPLKSSQRVFTRAFEFRDSLASARARALAEPYPHLDLPPPRPPAALPRSSLHLDELDLPTLVASCAIDHSVPPVLDTQGGSRAAQARWRAFRDGALDRYHLDRNDATRPGVSRMSAYLHYGHISPFLLAREAHQRAGKGAQKYLDELLVWRELAYHWCDRAADPGAWGSLPGWARETLRSEAKTERSRAFTLERLASGQTGEDLWDLAQRSLLYHGELHNNLRMTWGKALLDWTASPEEALSRLIELNNRYALDGRDPNSYAGLLWCLGLFDRPFKPAQPVHGTVRARSLEGHAARLDVARYRATVERDAPDTTVAVIGAGVAGLICGRTLADQRYDVTVFDKGTRAGGRTSGRGSRSDSEWLFDHGAPYYAARDPRSARWLRTWVQEGVLSPWAPHLAPEHRPQEGESPAHWLVGTPLSQGLAEHLAKSLSVRLGTRIQAAERTAQGWMLRHENGAYGPYDVLVMNVPPPQLPPILGDAHPDLAFPAYAPAHALLLRFGTRVGVDWDAARPNHPAVEWMCREGSKPGRPNREQWTLQSRAAWSAARVDAPLDEVAEELLDAFGTITGSLQRPITLQTHLWRYAAPERPLPEGSYWDDDLPLGICGDAWGGGVEGALLSGLHLAGRILGGRP